MRLKVTELTFNLHPIASSATLTTASQPHGGCQCTWNCDETLLRYFHPAPIHSRDVCMCAISPRKWKSITHFLLTTSSSGFKKKTERWGKKIFSSHYYYYFFKSGENKTSIKLLPMMNVTEVLHNSFFSLWTYLYSISLMLQTNCLSCMRLLFIYFYYSWHPRAYWMWLQELTGTCGTPRFQQ